MLYHPEKICAFSRACLKRGLAVVVVGYPATPLLLSRARLCVSASHTDEQIDLALKEIEAAGKEVGILYERRAAPRSRHHHLGARAPLLVSADAAGPGHPGGQGRGRAAAAARAAPHGLRAHERRRRAARRGGRGAAQV